MISKKYFLILIIAVALFFKSLIVFSNDSISGTTNPITNNINQKRENDDLGARSHIPVSCPPCPPRPCFEEEEIPYIIVVNEQPSGVEPARPKRLGKEKQQPISAEAKSSAKVNIGQQAKVKGKGKGKSKGKTMLEKRYLPSTCSRNPEITVLDNECKKRPKAKTSKAKAPKRPQQQPTSAEAKSSAKVNIGQQPKAQGKGKGKTTLEKRCIQSTCSRNPEIIVIDNKCRKPLKPKTPKSKTSKRPQEQPISAEAKSSAKVNIGSAKAKGKGKAKAKNVRQQNESNQIEMGNQEL
ncbi:hypothetical protein G9A89_016854 [Geosiphon pyriformis]|nr:hypothetical protein G9A89_016854 [Geosiphon pyriformis]